MLDSISGTTLPDPPWRKVTFDQVLQYYDGPRLLLRRTDDGQLYLAWWSDADESVERWLYLPVSTSRLHEVLTGKTPSRNALNSPEEGYVLGSTYRLRRMTSYKRLKRTHRLSLRIPYRFQALGSRYRKKSGRHWRLALSKLSPWHLLMNTILMREKFPYQRGK